MLVIRKEMMDALGRRTLRQFEDRMVAHLPKAFPEQAGGLAEPELRATVRTGMTRAVQYGVINESDAQRYLEYMMRLGVDFDTAAPTGWAGKILLDETTQGTEKMDRIDERAALAQEGLA